MDRLVQLLGSSTRANIVELLVLAKKPLSAYRVSKVYNMNIGKVYIEMKRLALNTKPTRLLGKQAKKEDISDYLKKLKVSLKEK